MFTDCPSCERLFRIRAAQLAAADGWVKCGYCAETFYALERLYDTPVKPLPPDLPPWETAATLPAAGTVPEQDEEQAARQREPPSPADAGLQQPDVPDQPLPVPEAATAVPLEAADDTTAGAAQERAVADELPPVLEGDDGGTARSYTRLIWSGFIVILLLIALAQLAWFNRDWLLREYPQFTPWAEKLCERLQCDVIRFRNVSAIKLVRRDVRIHPRYRNAVLVDATIVNHAEFIQPYPDIELAIYGTYGQVLSHGSFTAAEYLEAGIHPAAGMPPGVPVHLVLELAGAAQEAVGFEFRFH